MYLLSSWDEMNVPVELLADDGWESEYDKTGFLSVRVDIFYQIYLKEQPISFHMVQITNIKLKYDK